MRWEKLIGSYLNQDLEEGELFPSKTDLVEKRVSLNVAYTGVFCDEKSNLLVGF